jgi:hypothetical protein
MPSSTFHDLLEACLQTGCPVCRLEQKTLDRYISNLFYESVNDIKTRERLRASLGFCREHARMVLDRRLGNALGFAIIYQDVITNILRGIEKNGVGSSSLTPHKHCLVCQQRDKTLQSIVSALVEGLNEQQMKEALRSSNGLCMPHLKNAFESTSDGATTDLLLSIHREKLESLHSELAEFIRKNDYRFKDEGFGAEGDSWRRAVSKLTGDRFGAQE